MAHERYIATAARNQHPPTTGGAEKLAAVAMRQGDRERVGTVPIVNRRYIMIQTLVTSWKRMPADVRRVGIADCDEVGSLVEM